MRRSKNEEALDEKYRAEGWYEFSKGWPDRVYARINEKGELEVKFVEIKGPTDRVRPCQEFMHSLLLSKGIKVEIEPASKAPKCAMPPIEVMLKAFKALEEKMKGSALQSGSVATQAFS